MPPITCNIDKTDRINRSVLGIILMIAVLFGAGALFYFLLGLILLIEGIIGWCSIPYLLSRIKNK